MAQVLPVLPTPKFLLVDDQRENLTALAETLHSLPVELVLANSGQEAITVMVSTEFALIVINQEMAGLDGLGTAKIIRSFPLGASLPIVFLTTQAIGLEVDSLGIIDYLIKPINLPFLYSKAQLYLQLFQQKQTLEYQNICLSERIQPQQAISNSEANFRDIFTNISDGLLVLDEENYICYVNASAVKFLNSSLEELVGTVWTVNQDTADGLSAWYSEIG